MTKPEEPETANLDGLRERIDAVDRQLLQLINDRAALAQAVGELKRDQGENPVFYRPEREANILARIQAQNPGPLSNTESTRLMREIMSACLALEKPLRVAYLGPEGTYTHLACLKHFGGSVLTVAVTGIEEVVREVEAGRVDYAVIPVENSLEGGVNQSLDVLRVSPLKICGEVSLRIHHQLLSNANELDGITAVHAHVQALAQCRAWLAQHLPRAAQVAQTSNGEAAKQTAGVAGAAAIASELAAEIYDLPVLRSNIEDASDNTTRFLVLGDVSPPPSGNDVTSIMFTTANKPGALHEVLSVLAAAKISMTRIESRPLREESWGYAFFVDIDGHAETATVSESLDSLERKTSRLKILGSYPRAVI